MPITYTKGDMLADTSIVPVIPVNTVGVAGAGLAKQWATQYPDLHHRYMQMRIDAGAPVIVASGASCAVLFPTKRHWKNPSNIHDIRTGLANLPGVVLHMDAAFGIPKLGCGLGGLDWDEVKPFVAFYLDPDPHLWYVFE